MTQTELEKIRDELCIEYGKKFERNKTMPVYSFKEGFDACAKVMLTKHPVVLGLVEACKAMKLAYDDETDYVPDHHMRMMDSYNEKMKQALKAYEAEVGEK